MKIIPTAKRFTNWISPNFSCRLYFYVCKFKMLFCRGGQFILANLAQKQRYKSHSKLCVDLENKPLMISRLVQEH